jgi:hypothetical protein
MDPQFTTAQRTQLVNQVRAGFVLELSRSMVELGGLVNTRLTALMNEVGTLRERQNNHEFWTNYQRVRSTWVEETQKAWQSALKSGVQTKSKSLFVVNDLELVGTEKVENNILASRLAREVREKIGVSVDDLFLRVQFLLGGKLNEQDLLNPEVSIMLLVEQWGNCGMPLQIWPMINPIVSRHLSEHMALIYTRCNEQLIQQQVMPVVEGHHRFKYTPASPAAQTKSNLDASRLSASVSQSSRVTDDAQVEDSGIPAGRGRKQEFSLIEQLHRLLNTRGSSQVKSRPVAMPATSPALVELVAKESELMLAYVHPEAVDGKYTQEGVARFATQLREKSVEIKNKAETVNEKATIEIVALMFQSILAEARISPAIRVWFARLQMPVLRLALSDPTLVSTLDHPARQLIDRMGSCAMGFDAADVSALALEVEIKRVVQVIEQYPETGKQVFQLMLDEFQIFLTQFLTGKETSERLKTVAQQVEQKETLTIQYTIEIRKLLQDMQVGDAIRSFLFKVWAEALAVAAVRQGPRHVQTVAFKKAAVDLVRVASAKGSRPDRARAMQQLPALLRILRSGMSLLGLSPAEQEDHIKMVSSTLADAFLSKDQAIPKARLDALTEQLSQLEHFVSDLGDEDIPLSAQTIEKVLGIDASSIEVVVNGGAKASSDMVRWAQSLQTGAWFTLHHNGQISQVQLVWCSDRQHSYLFSARADAHYFMIQSKRLAAYLQVGLLVPLEAELLTVRATRDALTTLEANPERLLF